MESWIWIVIGLSLFGAELITGAFVMLILGCGALFTGFLVWLINIDSMSNQLILFVIFSGLTALALYFYYRNRSVSQIGQSQQFVGEVGTVSQVFDPEMSPNQNGQVRFQKPILGSDVWECRTKNQIKLAIGNRVRLLSFEGKIALVEAI